MKKQISKNASIARSAAVMALAIVTLCMTSCSKDDSEPSAVEILSEETTPVTFELYNGVYYLFDYAGSQYVGSDTILLSTGKPYLQKQEVVLRQGNHHLIWLTGLDKQGHVGVQFDPKTQVLTTTGEDPMKYANLHYAECDINVKEYLLPSQKLKFIPLTAQIKVEITDFSYLVKSAYNQSCAIGVMKNYPCVSSMHLFGDSYIIADMSTMPPLTVDDYYARTTVSESPVETMICSTVYKGGRTIWVQDSRNILCPARGLDNIQLKAEVKDKDANPIHTTTLPKFSVRRGYITILRGPLFSGSTSDWIVEMEPYEEM